MRQWVPGSPCMSNAELGDIFFFNENEIFRPLVLAKLGTGFVRQPLDLLWAEAVFYFNDKLPETPMGLQSLKSAFYDFSQLSTHSRLLLHGTIRYGGVYSLADGSGRCLLLFCISHSSQCGDINPPKGETVFFFFF